MARGAKAAMVRAADKVLPREEIARRLTALRSHGSGPIVFTNGVFDLLHVGHVRYLEYARNLGAALVVGINSDESVRSLDKAPGRPVVPARARAEVVAALACVDYACIFDEARPDATLRVIRPDIHVKSSSYTLDTLPEAATVAELGARIVLAPHIPGESTSELVARIRGEQRSNDAAPRSESTPS